MPPRVWKTAFESLEYFVAQKISFVMPPTQMKFPSLPTGVKNDIFPPGVLYRLLEIDKI